ncbi:glucose 1-dehydrogenase [soil metagenome]
MKAVTIRPDDQSVATRDLERPAVESPTDVLVRMLEVGICGTDGSICQGEHGRPPDGADFLVPGHEGLGEVVEVGTDVEDLAPGDLAVPTVRRPCPHEHCTACRSGNVDFCMTGDYTERGIDGRHGFLAEYVVDDAKYLCPVPSELRDVAVLTEPLSIAEKALRQYVAIQRRLPWLRNADTAEMLGQSRAVVLGGGPIGLLGCMLLRLYDVPTVVYSRDEPPAPEVDLTRAVGAEYISSEQEEFDAVVKRLGGVDLVYEATGAAELMFEVMPKLSANAVFIATGVPGRGGSASIEADTVMNELVLQNQVLCGTVNASRGDFLAAIEHLGRMHQRWSGALRSIITHRHGPDDFCESAGSSDGLKHVINPGDTG